LQDFATDKGISAMGQSDLVRHPEVNTLCSLIVELAWARLREDTSLLCLHGAAIEFAGRLVVFPSTRRAGKSTLTVALAAAGKKIFTDDFLPLKATDDGLLSGISSGISPRLRLPFPDQIGPVALDYIQNRSMIQNRQYRFVTPRTGELAKFGDAAPIGSLVFLERTEGATAKIEPVSETDALKALIKQNFSRAMNAAGILRMLGFITASAPAYRLIYDDAEQAVALLESRFQEWNQAAATFPADLDTTVFESALETGFTSEPLDISEGSFIHASGIEEVSSDGKRFLTGHNGKTIHFLNDGAVNIWRLLEEPTSTAEAIEMLCAVFPDHPAEDIHRDVIATFTEFARNGLLQEADTICQTSIIEATLPL
ncbi:MAG: PqqD family protein, partial [Alphaproteobacteria bacterium]